MLKRVFVATALCFAAAVPAAADTTLKLVEVVTSPERTETLKGIVAEFEGGNPGTHVEITSLPWGQAFEKFATMVSAGDTPDVIEMPDRWLALYAGTKRLENLEPYLATWSETAGLNDRALEMGRFYNKTAYTLPYGFYLRAMFYNKALFAQAGVTEPPKTTDEFVAVAKKISQIPGKSGYCLRGGPGGLNAWLMFGATMAGSDRFFTPDNLSTLSEPDWVKGSALLVDLYASGAAPKDSVNWGFNEIVSGFYSGTCAMLDQDPDALIAIAARMKEDEFGVTTMPKGPKGGAYPTLGFAGWSMFANSKNKDLSWKLIATLNGPRGNLAWSKRTGTLPIFKAAERDPFYASPQFKGWFAELGDKDVHPLVMPTYLPGFGYFADAVAVKTSQQALLGQITPEQLNAQWAAQLTRDKKKAAAQQ